MKKYILILIASTNFVMAQKPVTTYWDFKKTKKKEVFMTDANGSKNGNYKNFDEEGALRNEGNFQSGKKNGTFIEYTKFPNYAGKMQIKSKETYVGDIKEGPAVYFNYDADIGLYEVEKGNYKADHEDGVWTIIKPFTKIVSGEDFDYIKSIPAFKGSMAVKENVTYVNGEKQIPEGKQESFYYPSGKPYRTFTLKNGKYIGNDSYLYPDGKVWSTKTFDDNSKYLSVESYYYDGKLKMKEIKNPYSYEGYNPDGTPDANSLKVQKEISSKKAADDKLNQAIQDANKNSKDKLDESIQNLNSAISNYKSWRDNTYTFVNQETAELKEAKSLLETLQGNKSNQLSAMAQPMLNDAKQKLFAKDIAGAKNAANEGLNTLKYNRAIPIYQDLMALRIICDLITQNRYDEGYNGFRDQKQYLNKLEGIVKETLSELQSKGIITVETKDSLFQQLNIK